MKEMDSHRCILFQGMWYCALGALYLFAAPLDPVFFHEAPYASQKESSIRFHGVCFLYLSFIYIRSAFMKTEGFAAASILYRLYFPVPALMNVAYLIQIRPHLKNCCDFTSLTMVVLDPIFAFITLKKTIDGPCLSLATLHSVVRSAFDVRSSSAMQSVLLVTQAVFYFSFLPTLSQLDLHPVPFFLHEDSGLQANPGWGWSLVFLILSYLYTHGAVSDPVGFMETASISRLFLLPSVFVWSSISGHSFWRATVIIFAEVEALFLTIGFASYLCVKYNMKRAGPLV